MVVLLEKQPFFSLNIWWKIRNPLVTKAQIFNAFHRLVVQNPPLLSRDDWRHVLKPTQKCGSHFGPECWRSFPRTKNSIQHGLRGAVCLVWWRYRSRRENAATHIFFRFFFHLFSLGFYSSYCVYFYSTSSLYGSNQLHWKIGGSTLWRHSRYYPGVKKDVTASKSKLVWAWPDDKPIRWICDIQFSVSLLE